MIAFQPLDTINTPHKTPETQNKSRQAWRNGPRRKRSEPMSY
jgi:hypothetical protein